MNELMDYKKNASKLGIHSAKMLDYINRRENILIFNTKILKAYVFSCCRRKNK